MSLPAPRKFNPTKLNIVFMVVMWIAMFKAESFIVFFCIVIVYYLLLFDWLFDRKKPKKDTTKDVLDNEDYKIKGQWEK